MVRGRHLSILKPRRGPGQGDGPRKKHRPPDLVIRRSGTDRNVNFAKKKPDFVKINPKSISLMENSQDFVEPYFTKNPLNF